MSDDFSELASQVLSQDEIESLLEKFSGDEDDDALSAGPGAYVAAQGMMSGPIKSAIDTSNLPRLNFRVPHYLKKRQLRFLEVRHGQFARRLTDRLSLYLRKEIKFDLVGFDVAKYGELPSIIDNDNYLAEVEVDPFPVRGICQIPVNVSLIVIDRMLGGTGETASGSQGLTEIETVLMDQLLGHIMDQWALVWEDIMQCKHKVVGHESDVQHMHITSKHNPITIATFRVKIASTEADMRLVFPGLFWEPVMCRVSDMLLSQVTHRDSQGQVSNEAMLKMKLRVHAKWEGHQMSARELAGIEPGDFLYFNKSQADKTTIFIEDLPKLIGQIGMSDGKRAIKVGKFIGNNSNQ